MKKTTLSAALVLTAVWGLQAQAGVDPLTQIQPPASEWTHDGSAPDHIVEVPPFAVPATGVIDYINTVIPLEFGEEKWVKAVQFIPGDKRVLHHLLSYVVADDQNNEGTIDEADNDPRREFLEGYAPGKEYATEFPTNTGIKVPVGSALRMSVHYTSFGQETVDNTKVGMWFYDENETPDLEFHTHSVSARDLAIPPGDMNHEMAASHVFEDDIVLHGFRAHMHYRGKAMSARVIYPDNTVEDIINVADYNFAWQPTYRMDEPMVLPAGSRVVVEGLFDNSEYNPGNPDPTVPAVSGPQSWEEMFIGYFSYTDLPE
ncbi:hypothetical protein [Pseudohongiella acticola]|jgi:Copper type II ascorbate-dependent monooxygenase, C-terminal domain|uniref:monooxygenase n=1 Tax=Pseudohongiella acticola TaxID=1524254 RepID=UPI0030EB3DFB